MHFHLLNIREINPEVDLADTTLDITKASDAKLDPERWFTNFTDLLLLRRRNPGIVVSRPVLERFISISNLLATVTFWHVMPIVRWH